MEKYILPSADEAVKKMADYFIEKANYYIAHTGKFIVALSGGSSPKKLYELLATEKYNSLTNWSKIYFFFGDERYVPQTSADSNYLMAKKYFIFTFGNKQRQHFCRRHRF